MFCRSAGLSEAGLKTQTPSASPLVWIAHSPAMIMVAAVSGHPSAGGTIMYIIINIK